MLDACPDSGRWSETSGQPGIVAKASVHEFYHLE